MNALQIIGLIVCIIGILVTVTGLIFWIGRIMEKSGSIFITIAGAIVGIIGGILLIFGYHQQKQALAARQAYLIQQKKKIIAKQKAEKKAQQEKRNKELQIQKEKKNQVQIRELSAEDYKLEPDTIYKMYNARGQDYFDTQYDNGTNKDYALKHIGLTVPGLQFQTTKGQTATIDNLRPQDRKVVLTFLYVSNGDQGGTNAIQTNNYAIQVIKVINGLTADYPDVNFLLCFPDNTTKQVQEFFSQSISTNESSSNALSAYKYLVTENGNNNVGSNYGSLSNFANRIINYHKIPTIISVDQRDRISLTEHQSDLANNNDIGSSMDRFINFAFTSNDNNKVYNMLRSQQEINRIRNEGNQSYQNNNIISKK